MRAQTKNRKRLDRGRRMPSIYSRTEERTPTLKGQKFYFILLFLAFIGLLYFIFLSGYFEIKKINVNDLKYVDRELVLKEISKFKSSSILNQNTLTFRGGVLNKQLLDLGAIESAKVKKNYPATLDITIIEKTPVFVWETLGKKYLVDEKGRVTADYEEKFNNLPLVVDTKNVPMTENRQLVSSDFSKFIGDINRDYPTYTDTKIKKVEVPEVTSEIKVLGEASWYAYFDTTRTAKGQLVNLSRILSESKSKKKKLEYVDLRIDNRIFYK